MFDQTYIISLPFKKDRRERLDQHLLDLKGKGLDLGPVRWFTAMAGDWMGHPSWWRAGNGAWGCLMSHLHIMHDALRRGFKTICVLEDDVVFHDEAPQMFQRLRAELPDDWDQLYLGGQHLRDPWPVEGRPFILRAQNINRTHAFAHRVATLPRIISHILNAPDYLRMNCGWHIDHQLGLAHEVKKWNTYTPAWWLAGQEAGPSNISGRNNVRLWWQPSFHAHKLPFVHTPTPSSEAALAHSDKYLHYGWNLMPTTRQDSGLEKCVTSDEELKKWLLMIAAESLDQQKLPAWQHPLIPLERVEKLWEAGCHELQDISNSLQERCHYPFNGLIDISMPCAHPSPDAPRAE